MKLTKSEIVKIITAIRVQCPEALQYRNETEFDILVEMWFDCFCEYPAEIVWKATREALKNTEYQKQNWLGAVNKEIEKLKDAYEKSDEELWAELTGVLREVERCAYSFRYTYVDESGISQGDQARNRVEQIFNGLSPELQNYCRNQRGLVDLAQYTSEQLSYERGRFMRNMPQLRKSQRIRGNMEEGLAQLIQGVSAHLQIETNK